MPEEHKLIWELSLTNGAIDIWKLRYYLSLFFYRWISETERYYSFWETRSEDYLFHKVIQEIQYNPDKAAEILDKSLKGLDSDLFYGVDLDNTKLGVNENERNKKVIETIDLVYRLNEINFAELYDELMDLYSYYGIQGENYTPKTISNLLIKLLLVNVEDIQEIYDPTSASGYLLTRLLNVFQEQKIYVYAHELNRDTLGIFKMAVIWLGAQLNDAYLAGSSPKQINKKFKGIISNPYSLNNHPAFNKNQPTISSQFNLAFIYKCLLHLEPTNTSTLIITFPESILSSNKGEANKIKKYLIEKNLIDCVIKLPKNCFYGREKTKCIFIIKTNREKKKILFIDASGQVIKVNSQYLLSEENIDWIVNKYKETTEIEHISKLIPLEEIIKNQNNLSLDLYIAPTKKPKSKIIFEPITNISPFDEPVAIDKKRKNEVKNEK